MTTNLTAPARPIAPRDSYRVTALDALRGFALCGIILVNIPQLMEMPKASLAGGVPEKYGIPAVLDLLVETRFFPIFSFLFGLSFAIFLETAAPRSAHPRLLLLRRLVALGALGLAHHQLQPGEALTPYAIIGLLVLLPASWLPAKVVLPSGLLFLGLSVTLGSGGIPSIPGLFLLGLAVARMGVPRTLERRGKQIAVVLAVAAPVAIVADVVQFAYPPDGALATRIMSIAGLLGAVTYASGLLLAIRARPGRAIAAYVLEPLGRMALTNYVTATLAIIAVGGPLGLFQSARWGTMLMLAAVILATQAVFSRWWLGRFRYGPLEWALRTITWWQPVALRRSAEPVRDDREPRHAPDARPRAPFAARQTPYAPQPPVYASPDEATTLMPRQADDPRPPVYASPGAATVLMPRQTPTGPAPAYDGPHWYEVPWTGTPRFGDRQ